MGDFKKKIIIEAVIYVVAIMVTAGCLYFFRTAIAQNADSIETMRQANNQRSRDVHELSVLRSESVKAAPMLERLRQVLPTHDDVFRFRQSMEDLGRKAQAKSFGFSFGEENVGAEGSLSSVSFEIVLGGSEDQALEYLKNIETSGYLVHINSAEISGSDNSVNISIRGVLFYK